MYSSWADLTLRLINGKDLSSGETAWAMNQVMNGETSPVVLAGFLTALATKGETAEEVSGLADSMLAHARPISIEGECLDIVGTGGDRLATVNISTMASVVIAAAGIPVVKHGNRASSSACGSADCLEALGVNLSLSLEAVETIFKNIGITFCFANYFHPSMRFAAQARKELAVPTAFNILGPLTNPAKPNTSVIGVYSAEKAPLVAEVLASRGTNALVFRGDNGMDELSTVTGNTVWEVREGTSTQYRLDAVADLGLARATIEDLRGGDAQKNADVFRAVLDGESGAVRDAVCLNAAGAFVAYGKCAGITPQEGTFLERMAAGLELARETLDSGKASQLLECWVELSTELSEPQST